ncbi:MAG: SufS family cysteine desulfurase [Gammaproteobacteria bacterium]|nr:SufS family cysteine desulfurase [Gammaproteobacteria bacterium]
MNGPAAPAGARVSDRRSRANAFAARARRDFPALQQEVGGKPLAYLDNAASTQKPDAVIDAIAHYYRHDHANVHRGMHELARRATEAYEGARRQVARFLGAADPAEVVWTRGTTEAINLVASAWGHTFLREGDEIVLSTQEHHSNLVPWQLAAARAGARLRYLELDDEGRLRLDRLPEVLSPRTRMVALSHVSNALGTVNPIAEIAEQVHAGGALLLVDGAQGAPHLPIDVAALGCDFYAASGHKMCGPTGIGALWGRRELLEGMEPYQGGGEMISVVERDYSTWAAVPHKFEAGTPNVAGAVGMGAAADYLTGIGHAALAEHERTVLEYALDRLAAVDGIRLFGPPADERCAVVSFLLDHAHAHDVATILDADGVAVRAGHHCAQLVMKHFGVPATSRASFYLYNGTEDVDRLLEGLDRVKAIFG